MGSEMCIRDRQYTSPIESLYLCGAGSHPGGGLMGLAGRNAANEILSRES